MSAPPASIPAMTSPTQDLSAITDPAVRAAIAAWQNADADAWRAAFTANPTLTDDGAPRDFAAFSNEIGNEYFTAIAEVDGTRVVGPFHTNAWGDFEATYFTFHPGPDGTFTQLDIGQVGR